MSKTTAEQRHLLKTNSLLYWHFGEAVVEEELKMIRSTVVNSLKYVNIPDEELTDAQT